MCGRGEREGGEAKPRNGLQKRRVKKKGDRSICRGWGGGSAAVVPVEVFREPGFFSSPGLLSVLEAETDGECVVGANDKMCE